MKRLLFFVVALAFSGAVMAMSCIEYMRLDGATERREVLEPVIRGFLSKGYKKIPDWPALANALRKKILEKGYTFQNIEQAAEEAAIDQGMSR